MNEEDWVECHSSVRSRHERQGEWRPHPVTGRIVCFICHPPATTRLTPEERLTAIAKAAGARR